MSTPQEKERLAIQRVRGEYALWVRAHVAAAKALRALGRRIERGPLDPADDARISAAIEKRRRKRLRNLDSWIDEQIRDMVLRDGSVAGLDEMDEGASWLEQCGPGDVALLGRL